ncbi:MAG TPA: sialidase family protein, partial [Pyrinomonadaceae bacterium]|nr:sialidase family protein [Pyrinomonadaceae bacterium]
MKSENKVGRRQFLMASGGVTALAIGGLDLTFPQHALGGVPEEGLMERFNLDLGFRASRSGPVVSLSDGSLLWVTTEPEAPYLSKSMWAITRLVMRRSTDGGRSWGKAQLLAQGTEEYSLLSHAMRQLSTGTILHIYSRYSGYDYETGTPAKSLNQIYFQRSDNGGRTWGEAKNLNTGERYQGDILSMEQLRDGR